MAKIRLPYRSTVGRCFTRLAPTCVTRRVVVRGVFVVSCSTSSRPALGRRSTNTQSKQWLARTSARFLQQAPKKIRCSNSPQNTEHGHRFKLGPSLTVHGSNLLKICPHKQDSFSPESGWYLKRRTCSLDRDLYNRLLISSLRRCTLMRLSLHKGLCVTTYCYGILHPKLVEIATLLLRLMNIMARA